MSQQIFNLVAEIVFVAVAVLHALRLYFRSEVSFGTRKIPLWISWIGLLVAGYLSYAAHTLRM